MTRTQFYKRLGNRNDCKPRISRGGQACLFGLGGALQSYGRLDVETIRMTAVDVHFLAGDLTHAIVKRGCRDQDVIELSERLDYVDDTGDGSLANWYD